MQLNNLLLPYKSTNGYIAQTKNGDETQGDEKEEKEAKSGKKTKYTCECGTNVWGKASLNLHCNNCDSDFEQQD